MMTIEEQIKQKIEEKFQPEFLELINESHKHKGHAGDDGSGQTHFKLLVVSNAFEGCNRMQRHRLVYSALKQLFDAGLHALSIEACTSAEHVKEK
jgi:BolA protein